MAETHMSSYVNNTVGFVHTYILNPIVTYLNNKGVQVTNDELVGVLHLPAIKTAPQMPGPAIPGMAFGGAVPQMAPAVAPSRKTASSTVTTSHIPGQNCGYQFKRGENAGHFCGKPTQTGNDYCNSCLKNRKNLPKAAAAAGMVPGAAPGAGGIPQGYAPPVIGNAQAAQSGELSVVIYDESRGLYREPTHNFILCQENDVITVLGKLVDNNIVGLTPQDCITARSIGMTISNATKLDYSSASVFSVPHAPAPAPAPVFSVPQAPVFAVPQAPVFAVPQGTQVGGPTAMFSVPQASIPSVPQVGQIPLIPQVPQMQQAPMMQAR